MTGAPDDLDGAARELFDRQPGQAVRRELHHAGQRSVLTRCQAAPGQAAAIYGVIAAPEDPESSRVPDKGAHTTHAGPGGDPAVPAGRDSH